LKSFRIENLIKVKWNTNQHITGPDCVVRAAAIIAQLGDALIDSFFNGIKTTYDGPVLLAHDMSVINVTPEQIVIRQAKTSFLAEVPDAPELEGVDMNPGEPSKSKRPDWLTETQIVK
jgi:hypothetical protein